MKTKIITMVALAAALVAGAAWLVIPHPLNANEITAAQQKILHYTCPMHPSVKADKPGNCPVCGMQLVPIYQAGPGTKTVPDVLKTNAPMTMPGCCSAGGCGH